MPSYAVAVLAVVVLLALWSVFRGASRRRAADRRAGLQDSDISTSPYATGAGVGSGTWWGAGGDADQGDRDAGGDPGSDAGSDAGGSDGGGGGGGGAD